ncbi:MAG: hypothetical protein BHW56_02310 [Acetobacter sp. 46_36]|nr:MAG: hypothetical protein BHW56_02310 [Acetobacter sp. 46_36]
MNKNILLAGTAICLLSTASIVHAQTTNNEEDTFESIQFNKGTGWIASDESGSSYTQINYLTNSDLTTLQNSINMIGNTAYATAANLRTTQEDATTAKTQASEAKTAVDNLSKTVESELALKADTTTVTELSNRITTNEGKIDQNSNDIAALEEEQDEQNTKINNISSGTTYSGTGLEANVRNTATSVFNSNLNTALESGGQIYTFTNNRINIGIETALESGGSIKSAIDKATDTSEGIGNGHDNLVSGDQVYDAINNAKTEISDTIGSTAEEVANTAISDALKEEGSITQAINQATKDLASGDTIQNAVSEQVSSAIEEGNFATKDDITQAISDSVAEGGTIDTAINDAVTEAGSNYVTKEDLAGLASGEEMQNAISDAVNTATEGLASEEYVNSAVDSAKTEISNSLEGYVTDGELNDAVAGAVGSATGALETQIADKVSKDDMNSAISEATTGLASESYVDSAVAGATEGLLDKDTADGLYASKNDLNNYATKDELNNKADASDVYNKTEADNKFVSKDNLDTIKNEISAELDGQYVSQDELASTVQNTITDQLGDTVSSAVSDEINKQTEKLEQTVTDNVMGGLDKIFASDEELTAAKDELQGSINDVAEDVTELGGRLDTTETDINKLQSDMATVKDDMTTVKDDISGLQDTVANLDNTYATDEELQSTKTELQGNIDKVSGELASTSEKVGNLENSLSDTNEKVGNLETSLSDTNKKVDSLENSLKGKADASDVTALQDELGKTNQTVSDLNGKLETTDQNVANLGSKLDKTNETVTALDGKLETTNTAVAGNTAAITANTEAIDNLESGKADKTELVQAKNELSGQINDITKEGGAIDTAVNTAKEELNGTISDTKTELQGNINTAKTELEGNIADSLQESKNYTDSQLSTVEENIFAKADEKYVTNEGLDKKVQTSVDNTIGTRVEDAVNETVGDISQLGVGNKNLSNGSEDAPETIVEAINNIDQSLGTIHGLADKLGDQHQGNLADGTTVEDHLTSLDSAIGNRDNYTNANGSNNYLATAGADISTAISEIASNIGTAEDLGTAQNGVSSSNTVNQNIAAVNTAIGNTSKLANTHYVSGAANLTDAVAGLDNQIHNLDSRYYQLSGDINDLRDDFNAVMATMSAMTALVPNARATGNTQLSFGTGMYEGETAMALGGFHWINDNVLLNVGAAWGSADTAYRMGITYSW